MSLKLHLSIFTFRSFLKTHICRVRFLILDPHSINFSLYLCSLSKYLAQHNLIFWGGLIIALTIACRLAFMTWDLKALQMIRASQRNRDEGRLIGRVRERRRRVQKCDANLMPYIFNRGRFPFACKILVDVVSAYSKYS